MRGSCYGYRCSCTATIVYSRSKQIPTNLAAIGLPFWANLGGSLITQPLNILRQGKFSACLVLSRCTRYWGWYSWHLIFLPIYKLFICSEIISYAPSIVNEETKKLAGHVHTTHKMACINLSGLLFLSSDFWESPDYCSCNDVLVFFLFVHPHIERITEKVTIYSSV